jgi:hypothetical protein
MWAHQEDHHGAQRDATHDRKIPRLITTLAKLPPDTLISEEELGNIFNRHAVSVTRATEKGELPYPTTIFGTKFWTVRSILAHIEQRITETNTITAKDRKRLRLSHPEAQR